MDDLPNDVKAIIFSKLAAGDIPEDDLLTTDLDFHMVKPCRNVNFSAQDMARLGAVSTSWREVYKTPEVQQKLRVETDLMEDVAWAITQYFATIILKLPRKLQAVWELARDTDDHNINIPYKLASTLVGAMLPAVEQVGEHTDFVATYIRLLQRFRQNRPKYDKKTDGDRYILLGLEAQHGCEPVDVPSNLDRLMLLLMQKQEASEILYEQLEQLL